MEKNHPIEGLMLTAMNSIREMVDVNTIIGEPIELSDNIVIIPISKVSFGFATGGSEFNSETTEEYSKNKEEEEIKYKLPFGGGSGAGVSIKPISFLVVQNGSVKLIPVEHISYLDRLIDYVPDVIEKINGIINKSEKNKIERTDKIINEIKNKTKQFLEKDENKDNFEYNNFTEENSSSKEKLDMYEEKAESDGEDF